jgi:hypothetical protein
MEIVIHCNNFNTSNLRQISLISNKFWIGLQSKVDLELLFPTRDSSVDPEL